MLVLVPLAIGRRVVQAVVGREVDHAHAAGQQLLGRLGRGGVRQAEEGTVAALGDRVGAEVFQRQIEPAGERRMDRRDVRAAFLAAGEQRDLRLRMAQQELDQLQGRVAGGAENGDADHAVVPGNEEGPIGMQDGQQRGQVRRLTNIGARRKS